jgi:hypothetical protein
LVVGRVGLKDIDLVGKYDVDSFDSGLVAGGDKQVPQETDSIMMLTEHLSLPAVINPCLVLKEPQVGFKEYFFVDGGQKAIFILGNVFRAEKTVVDVGVESMYQLLNGKAAFVKSSLVESTVLVGVGGVVAVGDHCVVVLVSWSDVELLKIFQVELFAEGWNALR